MVELQVALEPPYPVFIGSEVTKTLAQQVRGSQIAIIAEEKVYNLHGSRVQEVFEAEGRRVVSYLFSGGEQRKTLREHARLLKRLSDDGFDRSCAVVALGGGITGDLAGFVAATYLRGVRFYNLPTTLLAMVDASVGGKTGVNLPQGKNLVGAFWQPKAVGMDLTHLATLPEADFRQGAVELFKHGLLADNGILSAIYHPGFRPEGDANFMTEIIARSVKVKADIIVQDERESGMRAFLNLGHTLAHALEAASEHRLRHGDAVVYGLLFNAFVAAARGWQDTTSEVLNFLHWVAPSPLPKLSLGTLAPYLRRDKKTLGGKPRFILLKQIAQPVLADDVSEDEIKAAWHALQAAVG